MADFFCDNDLAYRIYLPAAQFKCCNDSLLGNNLLSEKIIRGTGIVHC